MTEALKYFKKVDPIMAALATKYGPVGPRISSNIFGSLVQTIIGQQLSGRVADVLVERLKNTLPRKTISAKSLETYSIENLRALGISGAKSKSILAATLAARTGQLPIARLKQLPEAEVRQHLTAIWGIGPWTAEMMLMFSLGHPDIFSPGDLGLRKSIGMQYFAGQMPSPAVAAEFAKKWAPHRTTASLLLWRSLDNR